MKLWKKTILVVLLAIVLEVGYFNFSHWTIQLNADAEKNVTFSLQDGQPVNWEERGGILYSLEDPQIILALPPMQIQTVALHLDGAKGVERCLFYYTDADGTVQVVSSETTGRDEYQFTVKDASVGMLRFDTEGSAQMQLKNFEMVINPTEWHISISRMVAVVLIYLVGVLLFQTQKMPDYEAYIQKRKGDEKR